MQTQVEGLLLSGHIVVLIHELVYELYRRVVRRTGTSVLWKFVGNNKYIVI